MRKTPYQKAFPVVCDTLRTDADMYLGWQANIAMVFYDECRRRNLRISSKSLHEASNAAAKNFIDLLIKETKTDECVKHKVKQWLSNVFMNIIDTAIHAPSPKKAAAGKKARRV